MNDPQATAPQQQPQQEQYGQPVTFNNPPRQEALTAADRQTISQLAAVGKNAQEIAGLVGKPVEQVVNALGAASGHEPEF